MPLGDRLKGIGELIKTFKELLPIILEIVECVKSLDQTSRERVAEIVSKHASDSDEDQEKIKAQIMKLAE